MAFHPAPELAESQQRSWIMDEEIVFNPVTSLQIKHAMVERDGSSEMLNAVDDQITNSSTQLLPEHKDLKRTLFAVV